MGRTLIAAGLLAAIVGPPALAHGTFVDVRPIPGVAVGGRVDAVEFLFPEAIDPEASTIGVAGPAGPVVTIGGVVSPVDAVARIRIEPVTALGDYRVDYSVPSTDGTVFEGAFTFRYDPDADELAPLPYGRPRGISTVVAAVVLGGVAAVALLGWRRRARRPPRPGT